MRNWVQPDDVFWENEVNANRITSLVMTLCMLSLVLAVFLNLIGVFETGERMISVGIQGIIELAIPVILCRVFKGARWWLKYLMIAMLLLACSRISALLSFNVSYIMLVPLICSARYFSRNFTLVVGILTVILVLVADVWSFRIGSIDMNYVPSLPVGTQIVVETTTEDAVLAQGITPGQMARYYLVVGFLPKLIILVIVTMCLTLIADRGRQMVLDGARASRDATQIETELNTATQIQTGMLPSTFPPFPDHAEFDIFASMTPAKEVGGDFYDFFLIDDDHLGIVMADVSGKGIPAALFMMASKILIGDHANMGKSPAEVLSFVNDIICANNEAEMFVTVWLGVLDVRTGVITAANAGHEYPVIMQSGGRFEKLHDRHGLVIGGIEGVPYSDYQVTLEPGSKVFLYTDGVTEATNADLELYGLERLVGFLNEKGSCGCRELVDEVIGDVHAFVGDAEQSDDITMLCLEYKGPARAPETHKETT